MAASPPLVAAAAPLVLAAAAPSADPVPGAKYSLISASSSSALLGLGRLLRPFLPPRPLLLERSPPAAPALGPEGAADLGCALGLVFSFLGWLC